MKRREFLVSAGTAALSLPIANRVFAAPCSPPSVSVAGGTSSNTGCTPPPPPPANMPNYMRNMADFQVKNLSSVSGGNTTMFSSLPVEWQLTGQPNGADMVFNAWSGGAADTVGLRMFVHGGGHFDSSNNGIYIYDFNGDTQPVGWSIAPNSLSALGAVVQSVPTYTDGKPAAVHSYNGMWYDRNLNRLYRFGGSNFGGSGSGTSACFYYSFGSSNWVSFLTHSNVGTTLGSTLVGSPDGQKVLYLASTKSPIFVNASSAAATVYGNALSGSEESGFSTAMDTVRSNTGTGVCRYVSFYHDNSGTNAKIVTVNWPANTFTVTTQALSGTFASELNASGPCVMYDPQRDSFWALANADDVSDGQISNIYEISATTFSVSRYALSTPIICSTANKGGFNRHIWFPNWRIIGTVHAHNQPMSLIKVP